MPRGYREKIEELLKFSGSKRSPANFVNYNFLIGIAAGIVAAFFLKEYMLYAFIAIFVVVFVLLHGFLILAVDRRTKFIERILPDALQLMAANIKSGFMLGLNTLL